jgi:DNA-binding transcriptional MerR regulator
MPEFLNIQQAAQRMNVPVSTMNFWRAKSIGPSWCKIGKRVFYQEADLLEWIESRRRKAA